MTTNAWIPSARPIASATMTTSSRSRPAPGCRLRDQLASSESSASLVGFLGGGLGVLRPRRLLCAAAASASGASLASASARLLGAPPLGLGIGSASSWATPSESTAPAPRRLGEHEVVLDPPAALGDPGALADPAAQVVELRPADVAARDDLELLDLRRVHREGPLDADAERLLADGEGLARAAALARDHDPLEDLGALAGCPRSPGSGPARGRPAAKRGTCLQLALLDALDDRAHGVCLASDPRPRCRPRAGKSAGPRPARASDSRQLAAQRRRSRRHRRSRLRSRRHSRTRAWSPESSTSGTSQPR